MSYFFSQADADDEPTIWLETGEANAIPMLRRLDLGGPSIEDDRRLWAIIEAAVKTTELAVDRDDDPTSPDFSKIGKFYEQRYWALKAAEEYVTQTVPTTAPLNVRGYPIDGWRQPEPAARLELVLKMADFLLGNR